MTKLEKLQELIKTVNDGLTRDEFILAFQKVIDYAKSLEKSLNEKVDAKFSEAERNSVQKLNTLILNADEVIEKFKKESTSLGQRVLSKVNEMFAEAKINSKLADIESLAKELETKLSELETYPTSEQIVDEAKKSVLQAIPKEQILEAELPKFGESIRDGLELLPEEEKLEISAIKNLRKELDDLERKIQLKTNFVGGSVGKHNTEVYDLSERLDGVTKVFTLPAMWKLLKVESTSAPIIFRKNIDFTWTNNTITFTDEVNAETTLAVGQTVLLTYQE